MHEGSKTEGFLFNYVSFTSVLTSSVNCLNRSGNGDVKRISFTRFSICPWVFLFKNISQTQNLLGFLWQASSRFLRRLIIRSFQINVRHFWFAIDLTLWVNTSPGSWPCNYTPNLASVSVSASVSFIWFTHELKHLTSPLSSRVSSCFTRVNQP